MGEAKRRGNTPERIAQARAKIDALRPAAIVCNSCQSAISDIQEWPAPAKHIPGMDAVFVAHCPECKSDTFAPRGTLTAIEQFSMALARMHDEEALMGAQDNEGNYLDLEREDKEQSR